jgi:hypothetical protein
MIRKLRFSESWALKKVQLKGMMGAGRNNTTFRADAAVSSSESGPLKVKDNLHMRTHTCVLMYEHTQTCTHT